MGGVAVMGEVIASEEANHFREASMPGLAQRLWIRMETKLN